LYGNREFRNAVHINTTISPTQAGKAGYSVAGKIAGQFFPLAGNNYKANIAQPLHFVRLKNGMPCANT
jgi:hypothetical protein